MVEKDFSKCQCPKAGWCDLLQKEMTTTPPNWQWCQGLTEEKRKQYHDKVNSKVRIKRKATREYLVDVINFVDDIPTPTSDYAVCVIPANESAMDLLDISRDSIKSYAKKCSADYIELTGDQHPDWPMANKYRLYGVTSKYKKTLYLDCDVIVSDKAPNIFDATPDDKISAFNEYPIWKCKNEARWIEIEQDLIIRKVLSDKQSRNFIKNGKTIYPKRMINGGILVIPKSCSDYYKQPEKEYPRQWCFDQNYLTLILPDNKFNNLDFKWNCCFTCEDGFWYNASDAYFIHVNSLKSSGARKLIMSQISLGDFCPIEQDRYQNSYNYPTIGWEESSLSIKTNTFKENRIGLIQGEIAPGGALTWMKLFAKCFGEHISGIVPLIDFTEYHHLETGTKQGFSKEEMEELYVKSDTIIYWAYYLPNELPSFIRDNPLKKKIIYVSHAGFRHNKLHDLLMDVFEPEACVFVDDIVAKHYNSICIPPPVFFNEKLERNPVPRNILWHHRLEHYKGMSVLADIIEYLPDFNFHIAGNWNKDYNPPKTVEAVDRILSDKNRNVFYYGHLDKMDDLLETCSLSLSTSFDESFGLSVAESIAHGIPTVSHALGAGRFSDFTLNYKSHASEWAKAIRLCEYEAKEAKNKDYVRQEFCIERFEEKWRKVLCL